MKSKKLLFTCFLAASVFALASCKKDNNSNSSGTQAEATTQVNDQVNFTNETDEATNDMNAAFSVYGGSYAQRPEGVPLPLACDATVTVDTTSSPRTITVTYSGSTCNPLRTRTGTIVASFNSDFKWSNAGATFTITFNNFKVTRTSTGKSITINGVRTIKNVSGGLLTNLAGLGSVTHAIHDANASITFDDGSKRTWTTDLTRVFTYSNGFVATTTGTIIGQNRFGQAFSTTVSTQPLVVTQCSNFRYVSGQIVHTGILGTITATFGLDASGNAISDHCTTGLIYYQITWKGNGGNTWTSQPYPY